VPTASATVPVATQEQAEFGLLRDPASAPSGSPAEWKSQPRLWGHAFHPMCSYLGSFPAALAHSFIARYSRPGDVVLDPFSGRGTVPLQACAERRIGAGNDLNPLAALLTAAKVDPPSRFEAKSRLARLQIDWTLEAAAWLGAVSAGAGALVQRPGGDFEVLPPEVAGAFHVRTFAQILFLRRRLRTDEGTDRFLAGALLGILHGRSGSYVSDLMPNGFSLGPRYATAFAARRGTPAPERDVFALLAAKIARLFRDGVPPNRGVALHGDARDAGTRVRRALRARALPDRARLVLTSPPYLRTIRYGAANWLRLWFLGEDPAAVDASLDAPRHIADYTRFVAEVLSDLHEALTADAVVALVVGDVATDLGRARAGDHRLATAVWEGAAEPEGYRLAGILTDEIASNRKLTRLWGAEAGRATATDRILLLAPTELGRRRAIAASGSQIDWAWPPRRAAILARDAADVPPRRPCVDGSAGPHEEPGSRPHDVATPQLHPAAAGAPVRA
jgi:site-specific DNA-methyltransferase (adenine-specific)